MRDERNKSGVVISIKNIERNVNLLVHASYIRVLGIRAHISAENTVANLEP